MSDRNVALLALREAAKAALGPKYDDPLPPAVYHAVTAIVYALFDVANALREMEHHAEQE